MASGSAVMETQTNYSGGDDLPPVRHIGGADDPSGDRTREDALLLKALDAQMARSETVQRVNPGVRIGEMFKHQRLSGAWGPSIGGTALNVWGDRLTVRHEQPLVLNANGEFSRLI